VDDIVAYLEYIAKEEEVAYEVDAFNIIALKADGAMRDALSIFDQIVSFSGKSIQYADVIRNLNILDYDYYFRITGACLEGKVGEVLMVFNEILEKGFDEHNFLVGLSSHMRDLLVCLDPVTLQLLEVGAGIRDKYQQQSQLTSQEWLYRALDVLGSADVTFKASRNQRLHVELALIKLCNIAAATKKKALTQSESSGEAEQSSHEIVEAKDPDGKPPSPSPDEPPPAGAETTAPAAPPGSAPAAPPESTRAARPKADTAPGGPASQPLKKLPGTGVRIKDALNGTGNTKEEGPGEPPPRIRQVLTNAFTQDDLLEKWNEYADRIREERPRMSSSLKHHLPTLGDALQIEVSFSNTSQMEEFNRDIKKDLVNYLEDTLQNTQFKIIPVVQEVERNERMLYTSEEKYDHMIRKNPNLGKLKERFNLDFE
jgi:DNA polymerase-3 subunit gamma/tau